MANTPETIENIARRLEREHITRRAEKCQTLEDFQNFVKELEALCDDAPKSE